MSHRLNRTVLSIDVGTSGVRAALFDETGNQIEGALAVTRRELADYAEIDADALLAEVVETLSKLGAKTADADIVAISTFWHSLMGVAADGELTTPLLTWADTRAVEAAKELRAEFDEAEIHARTGCRFHPSYWPAKLRWLRTEYPEWFGATRQWLGFGEYLSLKLFGRVAASVSMASATGLFNQSASDWDFDLIEALGLSKEHFPSIGKEKTPGQKEIFIVGDGAANNIGGGCSTKDKVALMIGTSGAMRVSFPGKPPATLPSSLWSYRASRERVVIGGALSDGGGLLQWLIHRFNINDLNTLQQQLAVMKPDGHGLTILPFWSGERSTGWRADAHGGIFGLRHDTTNIDIIRASLEAIAYRFALIADDLEEIASGAAIVATGNALRSSPVWLQIIADVLGRPVLLGGGAEASMRGAALLALEAVGKIANIEAVPVLVDEVFEPDMHRHARYREGLARQQDLYERMFER